jgi:hypothetical protein
MTEKFDPVSEYEGRASDAFLETLFSRPTTQQLHTNGLIHYRLSGHAQTPREGYQASPHRGDVPLPESKSS